MSGEIARLHELYRSGRTTPSEVVGEHLARAQAIAKRRHAFTRLFSARALAEAEASSVRYARGAPRSVLDGVPVTVQDLVVVRASGDERVGRERGSGDAQVVASLRSLGAIVVGATRMAQFGEGYGDYAMGNPWAQADDDRVGGSPATVAVGVGFGSFGVDACGSLRRPAAWCGTVGFKPTQGTLSTAGVLPLSRTLDHMAVVTRRVADARILYDALTPTPRRRGARAAGGSPVRVGVMNLPGLCPDVVARCDEAVSRLAGEGADIVQVDGLPLLACSAAALTLMYAEVGEMHRSRLARHWHEYSPALRNRTLAATAVRAIDYARACAVRDTLRAEWPEHLARVGVDLLAIPTVPCGAPADDRLALRTEDQTDAVLYTSPFDLLGVPAVSVPIGQDDAGMPVGLQVAGAAGDDRRVLDAAARVEAARGSWLAPPGFADPMSRLVTSG